MKSNSCLRAHTVEVGGALTFIYTSEFPIHIGTIREV